MNEQTKNLIELCQNYIAGIIDVESFVSKFDEMYFQNQEKIPEPEQGILDEIYASNAFFEPDNEIREGDASFLTEAELRHKIQDQLSKLTG